MGNLDQTKGNKRTKQSVPLPVVYAIERLIDQKIWASKVSGDDIIQQWDAENAVADARRYLSLELSQQDTRSTQKPAHSDQEIVPESETNIRRTEDE